MSRRIALGPLVAGAVAAALVATLVMPSPSSEAFWSARVTGGSSDAVASTVPRVGTPEVAVANRHDVTVGWPETTLSDGTPVTGYVVTRSNGSGAAVPATGACSGIVTTPTCTETGVPDGRWTYAVVARYADQWVGPVSAASAEVVADTVAPTNVLSIVDASSASMSGSTVWFRGSVAGSFRIRNAVVDDLSGPASSSSGAVLAAGWSHAASSVSTPSRGPFVSNAYTWSAGTTSQPDVGISGFDVAGNVAPSTLSFRLDDTAPTGVTIAYADGTRRAASGATTAQVPLSFGAASDAGSGVATRTLESRSSTLSGDRCAAMPSGWTAVATVPAGLASATIAATAGTCVQYRYVVRDAVGNQAIGTSSSTVKVKQAYADALGRDRLMSHYRFDATSIMADARGGNTASTASQATTPRVDDGAISGDASTSLFYDGVDDHLRISRQIGASFSIELWFRSTQGLGSGSQWYSGAGLVDAEVANVTNDFGISLAANGRVLAGVGNVSGSDRTIQSASAGYNDGAWHHVVMTRNQSSGLVELWVDGVSAGTVTGGTQELNASANIDFGRLQTGIQHFRGNIDEVALYSRVLSAAEIQAHHANGR